MVTTAESVPTHKFVTLEVLETSDFKEYAQKSRHAVGARDDQNILIAWFFQMVDVSFKPFQKLFALMGHMRPTMKADPCLHFL